MSIVPFTILRQIEWVETPVDLWRNNKRRSRRSRRRSSGRSRRRYSRGLHRHNPSDIIDTLLLGFVPYGAVMFWPSSLGAVPAGWQEYTPLRDRVPIGAGGTFSGGTSGGTIFHAHDIDSTGGGDATISSDSHTHTASSITVASDNHTHSLTSGGTDSDGHTHSLSSVTIGNDTHNHSGTSTGAALGVDFNAVIYPFSGDTHNHTLSGSTGSDSHSHGLTGSSGSDSHDHTLSGSTGSDNHDHDLGGSTELSTDVAFPYHVGVFIQYIGV